MIVDAAQYPSMMTLAMLGAQSVAEVRDANNVLTGYEVNPDVDLTQYAAADQSTAKLQLVYYAQGQQEAKMQAGLSVAIGAQAVHVSTDADSVSFVHTLGASASKNPGGMYMWITDDNRAISINATQAMTIFNATNSFIQGTFTTLGLAIDKINAGTITTESQINAMFA